jgi:hypothetical protein
MSCEERQIVLENGKLWERLAVLQREKPRPCSTIIRKQRCGEQSVQKALVEGHLNASVRVNRNPTKPHLMKTGAT